MGSYKEVFIAHFETAQRRYGRSTWETKEFETKWEAEKFLRDFQDSHWYARTSGWVDSKVVDLRTERQKEYDARINEDVSRYVDKMWSRM